MKFEWDPAKNEENLRKHGFSLEDATRVFQDEDRLEAFDDHDYGGGTMDSDWSPALNPCFCDLYGAVRCNTHHFGTEG